MRTTALPPISPLEPRLMLFAFTLSAGVLRLYGDDTAQETSVVLVGNKIQATLVEGGVTKTQQQWTSTSVQSLQISGIGGNDRITVSSKVKQPCFIGGGDGNDTLIGGGGNDSIGGGTGNDLIDGGPGADTMLASSGLDTVDYSSRTNDLFIDLIKPGLDGEKGENDYIQADITAILCGTGNDTVITGFNGVLGLYVNGFSGSDTLTGGDGPDTLVGGGDNDFLFGGGGRDLLRGDTGKDRLYGGSGNDTLMGGKGIDSLYGEKGADKFYDRDGYVDIIDGGSDKDADSILDKDSNDRVTKVP